MWKTGEENGCGKRVRKTDVENGCGKRVRKTDVENGCGKRVCGKRVRKTGAENEFSDSENGFSNSENGCAENGLFRFGKRVRKTGFPIRKTDFPTRKTDAENSLFRFGKRARKTGAGKIAENGFPDSENGFSNSENKKIRLGFEESQLGIDEEMLHAIKLVANCLICWETFVSFYSEQLKSYARKIPDVSRNGLVTDVGEELKKLICSLAYIKCSSKTKQAKNRHSNEQGHWPAKSAKFIRDLLKNAESNTEVMSQDEDSGLQPTQSSTPSEFLPTSSTSKLPQNLVSSTPNPSLKSVSKRHTGVPSSSMAPTLEPISPSLEHSPMEFSQKDSPRVSPNSQKVPSKEQDGMWMAQPTALVQGAGQDRLNINKTFSTETQDEQSSRGPRCQETMGVAGASSRQRTSTNSSKDPSRVGNTPEHGEDSYTYD
ncbi:LOW QUALITY PROTEIN: hypothetical protein OSB04_003480 [Centaurea solstitialis]|uniref:Uncharacterized protein n=1 Tax=Centaurea solstitialis TaxID=347529 RepID=A0AA38WV88_9ASTR|nr:LOW QUALITY PROTEIN: hypothetical protein OSB04_003480 [Centaurea solstitialis]